MAAVYARVRGICFPDALALGRLRGTRPRIDPEVALVFNEDAWFMGGYIYRFLGEVWVSA